jgi:uncharacterized Fe-S cluster-containing radical SAM superfamily protein
METGTLNKSTAEKLRTSDIAHLVDAMREITFILEKNGHFNSSDRKHVDKMLVL